MAPRRADREPWSMTPSRMMTRQKVHPQARACLAAAVAVACLTTVPRPAHADLVLGTVADRPRRAVPRLRARLSPERAARPRRLGLHVNTLPEAFAVAPSA